MQTSLVPSSSTAASRLAFLPPSHFPYLLIWSCRTPQNESFTITPRLSTTSRRISPDGGMCDQRLTLAGLHRLSAVTRTMTDAKSSTALPLPSRNASSLTMLPSRGAEPTPSSYALTMTTGLDNNTSCVPDIAHDGQADKASLTDIADLMTTAERKHVEVRVLNETIRATASIDTSLNKKV